MVVLPAGILADGGRSSENLAERIAMVKYCLVANYLRSMSAISVLELACERIEADACESTEYFAMFVDSSAKSTSIIRPRAARILVFCWTKDSELKARREEEPPFCALK